MPIAKSIDRVILEAALAGLEMRRRRVDEQIDGIRRLMRGTGRSQAAPRAERRAMSPEARQRIADAQKKRWARFRRERNRAAEAGGGSEAGPPRYQARRRAA